MVLSSIPHGGGGANPSPATLPFGVTASTGGSNPLSLGSNPRGVTKILMTYEVKYKEII